MRGLPRTRAFRVLRGGMVDNSGFGSLAFEKPSAVRFRNNNNDSMGAVSCGSVRCTAGCFVSRVFRHVAKSFGCPSGVLEAHPSEALDFHAHLWLSCDSRVLYRYLVYVVCNASVFYASCACGRRWCNLVRSLGDPTT